MVDFQRKCRGDSTKLIYVSGKKIGFYPFFVFVYFALYNFVHNLRLKLLTIDAKHTGECCLLGGIE